MSTNQTISIVWSFCNTLRDDGVSYGDYLEQLTYLLFLKMADEYTRPPYNRQLPIPPEYNWQSLTITPQASPRKAPQLYDYGFSAAIFLTPSCTSVFFIKRSQSSPVRWFSIMITIGPWFKPINISERQFASKLKAS